MTGEEVGKVVSNNNLSSSSNNTGGGVVDLSVNDSLTSTRGVDIVDNGSPVTNGQSEVDLSPVGGDFPLTSDLSKTATSATLVTKCNNIDGKNLNSSSSITGLVDGDFEGISTNNSFSADVSNLPHTPQKRNGRTESETFSQKDEPLAEYPALSKEDLKRVPKDQLEQAYLDIHQHLQSVKIFARGLTDDNAQLKESEEKTRIQQLESSRRENVLVMRLTTKEQEMQEYVAQINELKSAVAPTPGSLRSTLLDPAVNFVIQRMKKELEETKKKLEDTQNDLNAWKFTPDSNTGKRLMAKCRMLYQENEDLGKMITSGKVSKLEGDLAIQHSLTEEMKKSQSEFEDLIQELDDDIEGMQSTIYFLQQQLREAKNPSNTSNSLTNTNNNSDEISVSVSELCSQCRATQQEKNEERSGPSQQTCLKMEVYGEQNSLHNDDDSNIDDERTCVNGDLSRSDTEESDRPIRTSKSKHSKDTNIENLIDDSDSRNVVQKKECKMGSDDGERRTKLKLEKPTEGEGECDEEMDLSYTSSSTPPTKRMKLANHSSPSAVNAATTKHLNPVQVQNSNESPILVNNSSGTSNRNGSVDH